MVITLSETWHKDPERFALLGKALDAVSLDGLFLEFGVSGGLTVNFIAERVQCTVHGFDWFHGLPTDWRDGIQKGAWSTNGKLPEVLPNVVLHEGLFEETLPGFVESNRASVAFVHIDCDLYESTKTVFRYLGPQMVPGAVIHFDQFHNFPHWEEHEYRAFHEFVEESGVTYATLASATENGFSAAIRIIENRSGLSTERPIS